MGRVFVRLLSMGEGSELKNVPAGAADKLQTNLTCRIIGNVCRSTGGEDVLSSAAEDLAHLVRAIVDASVLHNGAKSIITEVGNLHTMLSFDLDIATIAAHLAYSRARDAIVADKNSCFNKCMTLFGFGVFIIKKKNVVAGQFSRDQSYGVILHEIIAAMERLGNMTCDDCLCDGDTPSIQVPDIQASTEINNQMATIATNASDKFHDENVDDMNKAKSFQATLWATIWQAVVKGCNQQIEAFVEAFSKLDFPNSEALRPAGANMVSNIESLSPSMISAAMLPQKLAKLSDAQRHLGVSLQVRGPRVGDILEGVLR